MIKKDITFYNLDNKEVTKAFYFHYTKLEAVEIELTYGGIDETIAELNRTEDAKKAYGIFKELITGAVGIKSADGNNFDKSPEITKTFTTSPAMSVLIYSFIEDPESAGPFLEAMLPPQDVADGKARIERQKLEEALVAQQAKPQDHAQAVEAPVDPDPDPVLATPRTDEEILAASMEELSNDELVRLIELRKNTTQS